MKFLLIVLFSISYISCAHSNKSTARNVASETSNEELAITFSRQLINCMNNGTLEPVEYNLWNKPSFKFTTKIYCTGERAKQLHATLEALHSNSNVSDISRAENQFFFGRTERTTNYNRNIIFLGKRFYESATNGSTCRTGWKNFDHYCEIDLKMTLTKDLDDFIYDSTGERQIRNYDNPIPGLETSR